MQLPSYDWLEALLYRIFQCEVSLCCPVTPDYLRGVPIGISPHQDGGVVRCEPGGVILSPLLQVPGLPGVVPPLETSL